MTAVFAQAGVIPCRWMDGTLEVILISTSSGKHLTIPKGLIDPGFSPEETALNEAREEAGIEGELMVPPLGTYRFPKWGGTCVVSVFVMTVDRMLETWPEGLLRRRMWVEYRRAARQVKHRDLGDIILRIPERIGSTRKRDVNHRPPEMDE